jgi:hypothetical protein
MSEPVNFIDLYNELMKCEEHPTILICDAQSDWGKKILAERDGEEEFDGFWHAYIRRGDQTFYVPLYELGESDEEKAD